MPTARGGCLSFMIDLPCAEYPHQVITSNAHAAAACRGRNLLRPYFFGLTLAAADATVPPLCGVGSKRRGAGRPVGLRSPLGEGESNANMDANAGRPSRRGARRGPGHLSKRLLAG